MSLVVYQLSQGPIGSSIYNFASVSAPQQFMPTLTAKTSVNTPKTNTKVEINVEYPLMQTVDSVSTYSGNTIRASFNFTALRNVSALSEKLRVIDEMIAYLTANKNNLANGNVLPVTP